MTDKKATATARTNSREDALIQYLNGDLLTKEDADKFSCSEEQIGTLYHALRTVEPSMTHCSKAGGLGNHHDIDLHVEGGKKGIEVKCSEKKINPAILTWQPWEGGVEFAQGQLTSKLMSRFLGDCGLPMVAAWHQKLITEFLPTNLPTHTPPTLEDYTKVVFTINGAGDTAAGNLIQTLRMNEEVRKKLQQQWLAFEDEWFAAHQPEKEAFQSVLTQILEEKDYWININKNGAFLIEGFRVKGLSFVGVAKKPKGGSVFRYTMTLQKKSGGDTKEVPFVLKFYWKNGGQAVQNINILMVSDPFA